MKYILSIDGGGIRGVIPALVLAEIEKRVGTSASEMFDMIAGTSTGGIIALGLSIDDGNGNAKYSAQELAELYENHGKDIFHRSFWRWVRTPFGITEEKYSYEGLEEVLKKYFGDNAMGSALNSVLISSYDIQNREPFFFKSWRSEHKAVLMKYAARATSAAPTYFEPALVSVNGSQKALVDGGVFVNNPAISAYAEAKRLYGADEEIFVFSLGTGELVRPIPYEKAKNWGKADWLRPLLDSMFDGVSDAVNYQLREILGDDGFIRFQTSLSKASDDMDNVTRENMENLKLEAQNIINTHEKEIDKICKMMQQRRGE